MTEALRAEPWPDGRGPLAFLPGLLFRGDRPFLTLPAAWLLSIGGSVVLGFVIALIAPHAEQPDLADMPLVVLFIGVAIVSPLIESMIMGGVIDWLMKRLAAWQAVLVSAAAWGAVHSLLTPIWGLVIWWPFLIFSIIFVTWRPRGPWVAIGMATIVHALQNSIPAVAIVMGH